MRDYLFVCKGCDGGRKGRHRAKRSALEEEVRRELNRVGVVFKEQVQFDDHRADFAIPALKLVLEADGRQFHPPSRKARDQAKQTTIEARGWKVLRIVGTPGKLADDLPGKVEAAVTNRRAELRQLAEHALQAAKVVAESRQLVDKRKAVIQNAAAAKIGLGIPPQEFDALLAAVRSRGCQKAALHDLLPPARLAWLTPKQRSEFEQVAALAGYKIQQS